MSKKATAVLLALLLVLQTFFYTGSVTAAWPEVTVTFMCENTVIDARTGVAGETMTAPWLSYKGTDYFEGWYQEPNFKTPYTAAVYPAESLTLYAKYRAAEFNTSYEQESELVATSSGGKAQLSNNRASNGKMSLAFTVNENTHLGLMQLTAKTGELTVGKKYQFSIDVYAPETLHNFRVAGVQNLDNLWRDADYQPGLYSSDQTVNAREDWQTVTGEFTAKGGTLQLYWNHWGDKIAGKTFYLDNLKVFEVFEDAAQLGWQQLDTENQQLLANGDSCFTLNYGNHLTVGGTDATLKPNKYYRLTYLYKAGAAVAGQPNYQQISVMAKAQGGGSLPLYGNGGTEQGVILKAALNSQEEWQAQSVLLKTGEFSGSVPAEFTLQVGGGSVVVKDFTLAEQTALTGIEKEFSFLGTAILATPESENNQKLRFKAAINKAALTQDYNGFKITEYGFLAYRKDFLKDPTSPLGFTVRNLENKLVNAYRIPAYFVQNGQVQTNTVFAETETQKIFTALLVGFQPKDYCRNYLVRTYAVLTNSAGETLTCYVTATTGLGVYALANAAYNQKVDETHPVKDGSYTDAQGNKWYESEQTRTMLNELLKGATTINNPVISAEVGNIRDPMIVPYNGRYYMVGTTEPFWSSGGKNPGIKLWVSDDLVNWQFIKLIVDSSKIPADYGCQALYWAPELFVHNGKFYCAFSANDPNAANTGLHVFVAKADSIDGDYTLYKEPIYSGVGYDGSFFEDDDGTVYLSYSVGKAIKMKEVDMESLTVKSDTKTVVSIGSNESDWDHYGIEGSYIVKRGGRYYVWYSAFNNPNRKYEMGLAVTDDLSKPFQKLDINPVITCTDRTDIKFKDSGHNACFVLPDGTDAVSFHVTGNGFRESLCITRVEYPMTESIAPQETLKIGY